MEFDREQPSNIYACWIRDEFAYISFRREYGVSNVEEEQCIRRELQIPEFNGTNCYDWIQKMEDIFHFFQLNETEKMKVVLLSVVGVARRWVEEEQQRRQLFFQWSELKLLLGLRFGSSRECWQASQAPARFDNKEGAGGLGGFGKSRGGLMEDEFVGGYKSGGKFSGDQGCLTKGGASGGADIGGGGYGGEETRVRIGEAEKVKKPGSGGECGGNLLHDYFDGGRKYGLLDPHLSPEAGTGCGGSYGGLGYFNGQFQESGGCMGGLLEQGSAACNGGPQRKFEQGGAACSGSGGGPGGVAGSSLVGWESDLDGSKDGGGKNSLEGGRNKDGLTESSVCLQGKKILGGTTSKGNLVRALKYDIIAEEQTMPCDSDY